MGERPRVRLTNVGLHTRSTVLARRRSLISEALGQTVLPAEAVQGIRVVAERLQIDWEMPAARSRWARTRRNAHRRSRRAPSPRVRKPRPRRTRRTASCGEATSRPARRRSRRERRAAGPRTRRFRRWPGEQAAGGRGEARPSGHVRRYGADGLTCCPSGSRRAAELKRRRPPPAAVAHVRLDGRTTMDENRACCRGSAPTPRRSTWGVAGHPAQGPIHGAQDTCSMSRCGRRARLGTLIHPRRRSACGIDTAPSRWYSDERLFFAVE